MPTRFDMEPAIKVQNLSKKFLINHASRGNDYLTFRDALSNVFRLKKSAETKEEFWALRDVNFEIKKGSRIGILGRNGAGKSTLLKVFSRILEPTSGSVTIRGRVASLLEVGTGFHPELTGKENVFLNGAILGMSRTEIKKKFDQIVEFSEVEKFIDTPVKRYSSGMYVRLAFSVAAHLNPEILIIDEVLAVGDAKFRKKCLARMAEVSREGKTIVFVSHDINSVRAICNTGIFLQSGRVAAYGEIGEVINSYNKSLFGAEYGAFWSRDFETISSAGFSYIGMADTTNNQVGFQEPMEFVFETFTREPVAATVGLAIENEEGQLILTSHSNEVGLDLVEESAPILMKGKSRIRCKIDENFLRPGRYRIKCSLFARSSGVIFDSVDPAICFEVVSIGQKYTFNDHQAGLVVSRSHKWKIQILLD